MPTNDRVTEKRKSEIRSLLEANEPRDDDHKPEWMYSHVTHPHTDQHHRRMYPSLVTMVPYLDTTYTILYRHNAKAPFFLQPT